MAVPKLKVVNTLPLQIRGSRIRPGWFNRAQTNPNFGVKPKPGTALWTSSYQPDHNPCCEWLDFVVNGMPTWSFRYGYIYQPASDLKILEIDSQEDLHAINDLYGYDDWVSRKLQQENPAFHIHRWPKYGELARHFDAIHLTSGGQWDTRMPFTGDNLYGWDCESTCWLRLHRRSLRYVKKVRFDYRQYTRQELRDIRKVQTIEIHRMHEDVVQWRAQQAMEAQPELAEFVRDPLGFVGRT